MTITIEQWGNLSADDKYRLATGGELSAPVASSDKLRRIERETLEQAAEQERLGRILDMERNYSVDAKVEPERAKERPEPKPQMKAYPQTVADDRGFPFKQAWNLAKAILRQDRVLADDAVQEAWLRFYKLAAKPEGVWKSCVFYACRDVRRAHFGNGRKGSLRLAKHPLVKYVPDYSGDEPATVRKELSDVLRFLPDRHDELARKLRTVATWYASGASTQDIAEHLHVSCRYVRRLAETIGAMLSK